MNEQDESTIFGIFHRAAIPEGATPVENFKLDRYFGKWYEIARINYYWEDENLTNVFAQYSADEDGDVKVVNTGYNDQKEKWVVMEGKAKYRGDNNLAAFDVSFFGPIWAGYNVVAIDDDYQNALVFGRNLDYIWLLSREKLMPDAICDKFLAIAESVGYDISRLFWVEQNRQYTADDNK